MELDKIIDIINNTSLFICELYFMVLAFISN